MPLAEESVSSMLKHYRINFIAPVVLAQCMKKQSIAGSVILNVLDREISLHTPDKGSYLLSRKTLADATLELARELAAFQIRVNAIAPGSVLAPVFMPEKAMTKTIAASPLKRTAALEDLCEAAGMLIANSSLTGQIIQVDAGQHLQ
jgi:NAD(P)-dependent dehydrogenase (short-subunit alcohol dehydrogenase family)